MPRPSGRTSLRSRTQTLGSLLALNLLDLLRIVAGLGDCPQILHFVFRCLDDNGAHRVVACTTRAAGDLMELAGLQMPCADAVVLGETGQQHCADRDVDSDAQSVGTADHLEKPVLRENFDEPSVLGQHASMVNADAVPDQARECLSEPRGEAETAQRFGDRFLLGL